MIKVDTIQSNDNRNNKWFPVLQGASIGTAAGYVTKYIIPLTPEEQSSDEYVAVKNKIYNKQLEHGPATDKFVRTIKAKENLSNAEDQFIKMFDGVKNGTKLKQTSIRNATKNLQNNPAELREFERLCKSITEVAEKNAKQYMDAYNLVAKHLRPTGFFLATGAIVGSIIALLNNALKVEVRQ